MKHRPLHTYGINGGAYGLSYFLTQEECDIPKRYGCANGTRSLSIITNGTGDRFYSGLVVKDYNARN